MRFPLVINNELWPYLAPFSHNISLTERQTTGRQQPCHWRLQLRVSYSCN